MVVWSGLVIDVNRPLLAAVGSPLGDELLRRLGDTASHDIRMTAAAGSAHADIGRFASSPAGEDMGAIDRRTLHPMDGDGVGVVEMGPVELLARECRAAAGVESDGKCLGADGRGLFPVRCSRIGRRVTGRG